MKDHLSGSVPTGDELIDALSLLQAKLDPINERLRNGIARRSDQAHANQLLQMIEWARKR